MIKEIFSRLRAFRWQKLLIIWAVFVAIAAILFAERSGIQYEATKFKINYLPRTEVKSAQIAMFGQPVTCLLLYDSGQEDTDHAKEQFDQIFPFLCSKNNPSRVKRPAFVSATIGCCPNTR